MFWVSFAGGSREIWELWGQSQHFWGTANIACHKKKFKQVDPTNSSACCSVLLGLGHIPLCLCHTVLCSKMGEIKELLSSLLREKGRSAGHHVGVLVAHQWGCADTGLPPAGHKEKQRPAQGR